MSTRRLLQPAPHPVVRDTARRWHDREKNLLDNLKRIKDLEAEVHRPHHEPTPLDYLEVVEARGWVWKELAGKGIAPAGDPVTTLWGFYCDKPHQPEPQIVMHQDHLGVHLYPTEVQP